MREYINGFLQKKLIENQVTYSESLICMHILDFIKSGKMTREIVGNEVYYWINYDKMANDLAILGIKKQAISDIMIYSLSEKPNDWDKRLEGMSESTKKKRIKSKFIGLFKRYTKKDAEGTYSFFAPTQKLYDMLEPVTENDDDMKMNKKKSPAKKAEGQNGFLTDLNYTSKKDNCKEVFEEKTVENNGKREAILELLKKEGVSNVKTGQLHKIDDIDKLKQCLNKTPVKSFNYILAMYENPNTFIASNGNKNKIDSSNSYLDIYSDDIYERANRAKWENKKID